MSSHTFVRKTVELEIGGQKIILTPLTLSELQKVQQLTASLKDKDTRWMDFVNASTSIIAASMKRASESQADPHIVLDLDAWQFVWDALLELSKLKASTGEAKPAAA